MAIATRTSEQTHFCSTCARQAGVDPVGHAYTYDHVLAVEIPLPWPLSMYSQPGTLPQELLDLNQLVSESYQRGEPLRVAALAIAPDPAYSRPGYRRVLSYRRPAGLFAAYTQQEYLVPEADVGPLCWALLIDQAALAHFAGARQPASTSRDMLVCTHGTVDAACAKFGFPAYRQLRALADQSAGQLRVWRVSHFGGHMFAPTLLDMPSFCYWGFIGQAEAPLLALGQGDVAQLRGCYRGWAGFDSPLLQVADRELLLLHGWEWLAMPRQGQVLAQDSAAMPEWAELRIDHGAAGAARGAYVARVELAGQARSIASTNSPEYGSYPRYRVVGLSPLS